jgi:hypothetical protein
MAYDGNDPWESLPAEEALRRVRHSITPGWQAWTVSTSHEGIIWCARRLADGAVTHADTPARLLQHIADADEALINDQQGRS